MAEVLHHDERLQEIAIDVAKAQDVLYMGRGADFPIALEGALKLKEISYIHAEGYAAGELKHGPIALIDKNVPIIVIAPSGPLFDKTVSNMQEVIARDGWVLFLSDRLLDFRFQNILTPSVEHTRASIDIGIHRIEREQIRQTGPSPQRELHRNSELESGETRTLVRHFGQL